MIQRILAMLLLFGLLMFAGCAAPPSFPRQAKGPSPRTSPPPLRFVNFYGQALTADFRVLPSAGLMLPPREQLIFRYNDEVECSVESIADLEGLVDLRNSDDALRFVRIMSLEHARIARLHEWVGWEVSSAFRVDELSLTVDDAERWGSVADVEVMPLENGTSWQIQRTVLAPTNSPGVFSVLHLTEVVTNQGKYLRASADESKKVSLAGMPVTVRF